jgi:hypothetical protein
MKNLLTFGLVVCFFLVPFGCALAAESPGSVPEHQGAATAQTTGTPTAEVSETVFDFGLVSEGNDYVHAFKIRNTGTGVLVIRKIMPG